MTQFLLNGNEIEYSASRDQRVDEFMEQIRHRFNSEAAVISSIHIDGNELGERDEAAFADVTLSQIGRIEVFTAHPRELAEETLQTLIEFTSHLEALSILSAEKLLHDGIPREFTQLIDGIQTFVAALGQAKQILRIGSLDPVKVLEADLGSILKDLLEFAQGGRLEYVIDLLQTHLPFNLEDWRREGIPALIRSRDS